MTRTSMDPGLDAPRARATARTDELDLFAPAPPTAPAPAEEEPTLEARFTAFHAANPHVYDELVARVRRLVALGHTHVGIGMVWEAMRYDAMIATTGDAFRLNNDFRSRYARLLIAADPTLAAVIETRALRSA